RADARPARASAGGGSCTQARFGPADLGVGRAGGSPARKTPAMHPSPGHLDHFTSSFLVLVCYAAVGLLAWLLYSCGLLGRVAALVQLLMRVVVAAGFELWRRSLAWANGPALLGTVLALLGVGWAAGQAAPALAVVFGAVLLFVGATACLAYVSIDLERYEVARGYKALHSPLKGQQEARNLVRYGDRVDVGLLAG